MKMTLLQALIEQNANVKLEEMCELFLRQVSVINQTIHQDLLMNTAEVNKKRIKPRINQEQIKIKKRAWRDFI